MGGKRGYICVGRAMQCLILHKVLVIDEGQRRKLDPIDLIWLAHIFPSFQ